MDTNWSALDAAERSDEPWEINKEFIVVSVLSPTYVMPIKTNSIKGSIDGIDRLLIEFAKNNQYDKNYKFYYLFNIKCKCSEIISRYATVKIIRFPDPYFK